MSSPSNIVVIINTPPLDNQFSRLGTRYFAENPLDSREDSFYTDRAVGDFYDFVSNSDGFTYGPEGDCFSWAYNGNHINVLEFLDEITPFVRDLQGQSAYVTVTVIYTLHESNSEVYKMTNESTGWKYFDTKFSTDYFVN
jgi:hypothetical protein